MNKSENHPDDHSEHNPSEEGDATHPDNQQASAASAYKAGLDTRPTSELQGYVMSGPSDNAKFRTDYLNVPEKSGGDMSNRPPSPGTARLTSAWRLRWKIGEETFVLGVDERVVIGRAMEGDTGIGFDLTPFGAYHFGVSRMHAVLTLHDGYLYIEDLNSTNGTRINGFQVTPKQRYRLRDGDEIEFARLRTSIKFETPPK